MLKYNIFQTGFIITLLTFTLISLAATPDAATDLPSRTPLPTSTPIVTPAPTTKIPGGMISLTISGEGEYWTQVQWLAGDNNWYDVNGWAGYSDDGAVRWYAGPELIDSPTQFRWQIYTDVNGALVTTSDVFYMPQTAGSMTTVEVNE